MAKIMLPKDPKVSLIITTRNEAKVISRLLRSLKKQTYNKYEIIVVDNNSLDDTKKICYQFTKKVYNFGPERSSQRNYGALKCTGQLLFFLDADMKLQMSVLEECVKKILADNKVGAVTVPEKSIGQTLWEKVKAFERTFYNKEGDEITDAARFFTKEAFDKVGGYDLSITGPEDWDLPERIKRKGYKTVRINSLIYHYERIPSLYSLVKKKFYYAKKSSIYLEKQNISLVSPKTIYFLRPVFYKNWRDLLAHPILSIMMIIMLAVELIAGGLGFLIGKYQYGKE